VVKGARYGTSSTLPYEGLCPIDEVKVENLDNEYYTDSGGETQLSSALDSLSYQVTLMNDRIAVKSFVSPAILSTRIFSKIDSLNFETLIGDYMPVDTLQSYCATNVFHHITAQDSLFQELVADFGEIGYPDAVNDNSDLGSNLGNFDPGNFTINLLSGRNTHVIRHEASHYFTYKIAGDHQFFENPNLIEPKKYQAMDEAFAEYWLSDGIRSTVHNYGTPNDILNYTVEDIHTLYNPFTPPLPLNEVFYQLYENRYPLASAWWSLRGNQYFPSDNEGRNGVDTLLVNSLAEVGENTLQNNSYRYKPRYFYNILMSRVDTDGISWPLNDKQLAINKAYDDRGFHFYPSVQSVAHSYTASAPTKETYNVQDSVYVKIENCPQNTDVKVLIIPHREYNNVGIDGITIPTAYEANGNQVSKLVRTSITGTWAGDIPFSNQLPPGDYDIIVDVGSPTAPDNRLNLVFDKDNIIDAVDGLEVPGFTKTGWGDAVVALDLSSSMDGYGMQLAKTVLMK
jgi:hypothetical protein